VRSILRLVVRAARDTPTTHCIGFTVHSRIFTLLLSDRFQGLAAHWEATRQLSASATLRVRPNCRNMRLGPLWVFLQGVLFYLKDVLKKKSRPSADDGGHAGADVLELVRP
jgi:hypothetical protein